jgi:hypothetical protein
MNAISLSVNVSVSDPKDLVLVHQAVEHLMAELNSINTLSVPVNPVVVVDPVSGFVAKNPLEGIDVAAIAAKVVQAPKVKRPRTAAQLAHDQILRQQSIERHLKLGHTVKADPKDEPIKSTKNSKKAPAANQGLIKRPVHVPAPKDPVVVPDPIYFDIDDVDEGETILVETKYADGHSTFKREAANTPAKSTKKSNKRVVEVQVKGKAVKKSTHLDKPVKLSEVVGKGSRKVAPAPAAE